MEFAIKSRLTSDEVFKILKDSIEADNFSWNPFKKHRQFKGSARDQKRILIKLGEPNKNYSPLVEVSINVREGVCELFCQARLPGLSYILTVVWAAFMLSLFLFSSIINIENGDFGFLLFSGFILGILLVGIMVSKKQYLLQVRKIESILNQIVDSPKD